MAVDDSMTNTQQQVYNGDHRKYFEIPCIVFEKSAIELIKTEQIMIIVIVVVMLNRLVSE